MSIEESLATLAASATRIADALELISAGGSPNVQAAPKPRSKTKAADAAPAPAATPTVPDTLPGFAFPNLNPVVPAAEVPVATAPDVMPAFSMDGFLGQDPTAAPATNYGDLPCPFEGSRDGFKGYIAEVAGFCAGKGINPGDVIIETLSRFGASQQSQILEAQFGQVYNAFEQFKAGVA